MDVAFELGEADAVALAGLISRNRARQGKRRNQRQTIFGTARTHGVVLEKLRRAYHAEKLAPER